MSQPTAHNNLLQSLRRVSVWFGARPLSWVLVVIAAIVGAATEPMIPALLKPLLDRGFQHGEIAIWTVPASLLLLFGVRGSATYLAQLGLTQVTQAALRGLRRAMFQKLLTADLTLFRRESASSLSNTLVYETQTGAVTLVGAALNLIRNSLTLVALTAYLIYLNWQLTLIVAAIFPMVGWVMRRLTLRVHSLTASSQTATDALAYVVEENVLAYRDVRLAGAQTEQAARFDTLSDRLSRLAWKSQVASAAMTPVTQMLAAIALSAVISVALVQSAHADTSVGSFTAFVMAMLMIVSPIRQLSEVSSPITRALVALERAIDLIEANADETEGTHTQARASGAMVFSNAQVQYADATQPALSIGSLTIAPGETIALVGSSGAGKSTLIHVLTRFVPLSAGTVTLDGVSLNEWQLTTLRAQFALVSQHVVLFNASVSKNVALGQAIDPARVHACLQAAFLGEWLDAQREGIDTLIGHNGAQLSGGQRQRLAIARALYRDAPILLLDEATSALDTESERAVQDALSHLMRGRTTLVIAHRLSTVAHCDRIVVMDAGQIVESGTHASLLQLNGHYARLYQMGLNPSQTSALA